MDILSATQVFMEKGGQEMATWIESTDDDLDDGSSLRELRRNLLREEYQEYVAGENENNIVEIVDGLLDVIVVAWGTILAYVGPDRAKTAADEVVRSNLAKVIGDGLPLRRADGKIIKPPGWTPPDIAKALDL